jgi:hypothetical protein
VNRIPVGARFSAPVQTVPGAHPAFYTMSTGSFLGVKRPGRCVDHPPLSSAVIKERVEVYTYSPSGSSWTLLLVVWKSAHFLYKNPRLYLTDLSLNCNPASKCPNLYFKSFTCSRINIQNYIFPASEDHNLKIHIVQGHKAGIIVILDFKLLPYSECCMLPSG